MTMFVLIQDIYKRFNFITSKNWSPGLAIHNVLHWLVPQPTKLQKGQTLYVKKVHAVKK